MSQWLNDVHNTRKAYKSTVYKQDSSERPSDTIFWCEHPFSLGTWYAIVPVRLSIKNNRLGLLCWSFIFLIHGLFRDNFEPNESHEHKTNFTRDFEIYLGWHKLFDVMQIGNPICALSIRNSQHARVVTNSYEEPVWSHLVESNFRWLIRKWIPHSICYSNLEIVESFAFHGNFSQNDWMTKLERSRMDVPSGLRYLDEVVMFTSLKNSINEFILLIGLGCFCD